MRLSPLDAKGAQTLQMASTREKSTVAKGSMKERSKSYDDVEMTVDKSEYCRRIVTLLQKG